MGLQLKKDKQDIRIKTDYERRNTMTQIKCTMKEPIKYQLNKLLFRYGWNNYADRFQCMLIGLFCLFVCLLLKLLMLPQWGMGKCIDSVVTEFSLDLWTLKNKFSTKFHLCSLFHTTLLCYLTKTNCFLDFLICFTVKFPKHHYFFFFYTLCAAAAPNSPFLSLHILQSQTLLVSIVLWLVSV